MDAAVIALACIASALGGVVAGQFKALRHNRETNARLDAIEAVLHQLGPPWLEDVE